MTPIRSCCEGFRLDSLKVTVWPEKDQVVVRLVCPLCLLVTEGMSPTAEQARKNAVKVWNRKVDGSHK